MKATVARAALAGAVALTVAPLAAPSHATCGPVVIEACRIVCQIPNPTIYRLCTIT